MQRSSRRGSCEAYAFSYRLATTLLVSSRKLGHSSSGRELREGELWLSVSRWPGVLWTRRCWTQAGYLGAQRSLHLLPTMSTSTSRYSEPTASSFLAARAATATSMFFAICTSGIGPALSADTATGFRTTIALATEIRRPAQSSHPPSLTSTFKV